MSHFLNKRVGALTIIAMLSVNSLNVLAESIDSNTNIESYLAKTSTVKAGGFKYIGIKELNEMSYKNVIEYLIKLDKYRSQSGKYYQFIREFAEANESVFEFFGDENRLQALIDAIVERAPKYTSEDTKGIFTLIEVIRLGYYVGFYNDELKYLREIEGRNKCLPALSAIQSNSNFKLGTREQDILVKNTAMLMGTTTCSAEIVNGFLPVLEDYLENKEDYLGNYSHNEKEHAVYNIMLGVKDAANNIIYFTNINRSRRYRISAEDTYVYGKIDNFIDYVGTYALMGNYTSKNSVLINNGIWVVEGLGKFRSNKSKVNRVLTEAVKLYPEMSEPYLQAVTAIKSEFGGIDYYGNRLDEEKLKNDMKNKLLPKKYSFDDGKFIFIAGGDVTEEKIERLYWAAKEVSAQFFRFYGRDKALEEGNPDEVMTAVIYNNKEDYKKNRFLNGYDTNNGGIYIEKRGTLYTWDRTSEESRYTLEELFRHEFTHYLQGRYTAPGFWGEGIYKNNRITWFEEGGAEFFAGATRKDGVLPRKSVITNNGSFSSIEAGRFTVKELMDYKTYSGELYAYSYAMRSFINNKKPDIFQEISNIIKNNDIKKYDQYISELRVDSGLNSEFQTYMNRLYDNRFEYKTPLVNDSYISDHKNIPSEEIYKTISETAELKDVEVKNMRSEFFNTFTLKGSFTGEKSLGRNLDDENMDELADAFLERLDTLEWSGYKTVTCYFTNHRVDSQGNFKYDLVFHGLLTGEIDAGYKEKYEENQNKNEKADFRRKIIKKSGNLKENQLEGILLEVTKKGDVQIELESSNIEGINWILYKDKNYGRRVAYANKVNGVFKNSIELEKGKYYLSVYSFDKGINDYKLKISGLVKNSTN